MDCTLNHIFYSFLFIDIPAIKAMESIDFNQFDDADDSDESESGSEEER